MTDWKQDLRQSIEEHESETTSLKQQEKQQEDKAADFIKLKVLPAFEEFKSVLTEQGREVSVSGGSQEASIKVTFEGRIELEYRIETRVYPKRTIAVPIQFFREGREHFRAEGYFRSGAQDYTIEDLSKDEIVRHLVAEYKSRLASLRKR